MGFCPYYDKNCPHNDECELWDTASGTCGIKRQKSLLELINLKGEDSIASSPPVGGYKIINTYYDEEEDEQVLITSDMPEE